MESGSDVFDEMVSVWFPMWGRVGVVTSKAVDKDVGRDVAKGVVGCG